MKSFARLAGSIVGVSVVMGGSTALTLAAPGVPPGGIVPPGGGSPGPGGAGPGGHPNLSEFDQFLGLDEGGNPPLTYDFGDAPDQRPLCGLHGGNGSFPTLRNSPSAAANRDAPYHKPVSVFGAVILGKFISYELSAVQPQCDWLTAGCDGFGDDAPLVLCFDGSCNSGLTLGDSVCGASGFGASFGPRPSAAAQAFWVFYSTRGDNSEVNTWINVITDADQSGVFDDDPDAWCLRDREVKQILGNVQLHRTDPFPAGNLIYALPNNHWGVDAFWTRFTVSEEQVLEVIPGDWDGSGPVGGYNGGETEDWLAQSSDDEYLCRLPASAFESVATVSISLNPGAADCAAGEQVQLSSAGQPIGILREFRTTPYRANRAVPLELRQLSLAGSAPGLGGGVIVRESASQVSFGLVDDVTTAGGAFETGTIRLDARLEIELTGLGVTLTTGDGAVRLDAGAISAMPPINAPFTLPAAHGRIPLFDKTSGLLAGWLCVSDFHMTQSVAALCSGDANDDRKVDFADISAVVSNWGSGGPVGDSSGDCVVDFIDISAAIVHWGNSCR